MKRIAAGILAALLVAAAQAEPLYISDKLVVNVYAEADQESGKVTTLDSGDAVEALEKVESFTHVRLPDNREGWIKSSYLSSQVPAIVRVKELEKERNASAQLPSQAPTTQLAEELKQAKEHNAVLQQELAAAKTAAVQVSAAAPVNTSPSQSRLEVDVSTPTASRLHAAYWSAGVAILGGVFGYALGYQALARRIRRKYGSVKIY